MTVVMEPFAWPGLSLSLSRSISFSSLSLPSSVYMPVCVSVRLSVWPSPSRSAHLSLIFFFSFWFLSVCLTDWFALFLFGSLFPCLSVSFSCLSVFLSLWLTPSLSFFFVCPFVCVYPFSLCRSFSLYILSCVSVYLAVSFSMINSLFLSLVLYRSPFLR